MKNKNKISNKTKNNMNIQNSKFKNKCKLVFEKLKALLANSIYPDNCNCIMCDKEIPSDSKYGLCENCYNKLPFNNQIYCVKCGVPMENEATYCLQCQNNERHFDFVRSCFVYENEIKKLILNLKFHNCKWVAKYFADMLFDCYNLYDLNAELIIPVPISKEREKQRGYNQTKMFAKPLAEKLNIPISIDTILKIKDVSPQTKLSGKQRHENVKGAYKVINDKSVKGKRVLIIDDILTTGSTIDEVAKQLKIAGASAVYGLVLASPKYILLSDNFNDQNVNAIMID